METMSDDKEKVLQEAQAQGLLQPRPLEKMASVEALEYAEIMLLGIQKQELVDGKMVWVTHYKGSRFIFHSCE